MEIYKKLIEIIQWIMVSIWYHLLQTLFLFVDLQWIILYWSDKLIITNTINITIQFCNHQISVYICMVLFYSVGIQKICRNLAKETAKIRSSFWHYKSTFRLFSLRTLTSSYSKLVVMIYIRYGSVLFE